MTSDITGRDDYVQAKALAYAITAIDGLPDQEAESSDRDDMVALFNAIVPNDGSRKVLLSDVEAHMGRAPDMTDYKRSE